MIKVWVDNEAAGVLDRSDQRGSIFVYNPVASQSRAVSLTMPVRLRSWNAALGILPIFEMNLPEGALRERLRLAFAKATGSFDEVALLAIVGRSQIGRIRFTGVDEQLDEDVPFQSVDELLVASGCSRELYRSLIDKFAIHSGISGVQPKFLIRDETRLSGSGPQKPEFPRAFRGATHIVKFWDPIEFPQLSANEFFCLQVAKRCGLIVPAHHLAMDGSALVVERFDVRPDGRIRGFEDFCVLNARRTEEKYRGSYETNVLRRFQQYANSPSVVEESLQLFTLITLNCAIRNGDADLKNFGILYDEVQGEAHLAPVYDLVTTTVYLPQDRMALTLNGTNQWPSSRDLIRFGEGRSLGTRRTLTEIFERIGDALSDTREDVLDYCKDHPEFADVAEKMVEQWEIGRASLKVQG